jgi:predicted DNA-binding transcriptional regulator YafY
VLAPTSRLLQVLELLQARPMTTGREIAERLGVDRRTVRRYVEALQALGIPVEGERGAGGGYRVRPGFRLPPLMLDDDEAVTVVLGLLAAGRMGHPVDGALGKLRRVLPEVLRRRVEALEATIGFTGPPADGAPVAGAAALSLADAIRRGRRVTAEYVSRAGERTTRELSPHGLVVHDGRWYLAAHDHGRAAMRTFRVDRIAAVDVGALGADPPPDGFDAVAHVSRSLARVPWPYEVEVLLDLPPEEAARRLPSTLAECTEQDGRTLLRLRAASLEWVARLLGGLGCELEIRRPAELRAHVRTLAARLAAAAD